MKWVRFALGITLFLQVIAVSQATAQETPFILSERLLYKEIRIASSAVFGNRIGRVGRIVALNADTLMLTLSPRTSPVAIPLSSVTKLEIKTKGKKKRNTLKGAGIGLLVGACGGMMVGFVGGEDCTSSGIICFPRGDLALALGVVAGGVGGTLGAIIGTFVRSEQDRWEHILLKDLRLGLRTVHNDRLMLSASINF